MERLALQRLLQDICDGLVNCVVVYKVDRLSRSLLDFARIMEVFDKHRASFVSVTQQFNTTASLGRLTLNVLLSFAQFEREMIAERTRDKMSAARRKGKWVGGNPVLGYDVDPDGGALVVNEEEAARVRAIFALYLELGSLLPVVEELARRGWTLKRWTTCDGKIAGGKVFSRPRLHQLLTNILYTGRIRHRGEIFAGEHPAIVEDTLWQKVQDRLRMNGPRSSRSLRNKYGALLKGIVRCASCQVGMVHTYTQKDGRNLPLLRLRQGSPARLEPVCDAVGIGAGTGSGSCEQNAVLLPGLLTAGKYGDVIVIVDRESSHGSLLLGIRNLCQFALGDHGEPIHHFSSPELQRERSESSKPAARKRPPPHARAARRPRCWS
jgi:DNA invertase Pin-like site-specific DNA recombinase